MNNDEKEMAEMFAKLAAMSPEERAKLHKKVKARVEADRNGRRFYRFITRCLIVLCVLFLMFMILYFLIW